MNFLSAHALLNSASTRHPANVGRTVGLRVGTDGDVGDLVVGRRVGLLVAAVGARDVVPKISSSIACIASSLLSTASSFRCTSSSNASGTASTTPPADTTKPDAPPRSKRSNPATTSIAWSNARRNRPTGVDVRIHPPWTWTRTTSEVLSSLLFTRMYALEVVLCFGFLPHQATLLVTISLRSLPPSNPHRTIASIATTVPPSIAALHSCMQHPAHWAPHSLGVT